MTRGRKQLAAAATAPERGLFLLLMRTMVRWSVGRSQGRSGSAPTSLTLGGWPFCGLADTPRLFCGVCFALTRPIERVSL